jgi:hypothetical protein
VRRQARRHVLRGIAWSRHNFAFMDCDIFHNEDEMRKQARHCDIT